MRQNAFFTSLLLAVTSLSLLFGFASQLARERELKHRLYVEESLLRATRAKILAEKELEVHKGRAALLERKLVALERTNRFTIQRLRGLERRLTAFQKEVTQARATQRSLESERPASQEVDLGQIVVSTAAPLQGKVVAVNQPYQFIVVDLGREQNVSEGTILGIYRETDFIGRVQVESVRQKVAACRVLPEWTREEIQKDDLVKEL